MIVAHSLCSLAWKQHRTVQKHCGDICEKALVYVPLYIEPIYYTTTTMLWQICNCERFVLGIGLVIGISQSYV